LRLGFAYLERQSPNLFKNNLPNHIECQAQLELVTSHSDFGVYSDPPFLVQADTVVEAKAAVSANSVDTPAIQETVQRQSPVEVQAVVADLMG